MKSIFSYNLFNIRQLCNLTYDEMSKILNVPPTTLSSYEKGLREPKLSVVINIAKCLNVSIDDLVTKYISLETYQKNDFYKNHIYY